MMHDLSLFGWRLRSSVEIDILAAWTGDPDHPVDVTMEEGPAPQIPASNPADVVLLDDDSAVVIIEGVGRFHVIGGRHVIADILPDVPTGVVDTTFIGPVFGTLCYQRQIQSFHCNTVVVDGKAVALSGPSGTGKSTLAAVLVSRGHQLISDDVMAVDYNDGLTFARTGNRHLRLWRDSLELLGYSTDGLRRAAMGERDKYFLPARPGLLADRWPLKALIWIESTPTHTDQLNYLVGAQRANVVACAVYRRHLLHDYVRRGHSKLADLTLPGTDVFQMTRPRDLDRIGAQADAIEQLARS